MTIDSSSPTRYRAIGDVLKGEAERAANHLVVGATIVACVGVPISVSRAFSFGWSVAYGIHIAGLLAMLLICWLRHRLAVRTSSVSCSSSRSAFRYRRCSTPGIYGNGALWGAFSVFVASMFLRRRSIVMIAAGFLGLYLLSGYGFISGRLSLPADPMLYLQSPAVWGSAIFGSFFFLILIIIVYTNHTATTQHLILELETKTKQLAMMADHDSLTGLPNLRSATAHTDAIIARLPLADSSAALFFVDLDGFKAINDRHGHDAGDHLLKAVAAALLGIVRSGDIVARVGGDEFLILLTDFGETPLPDLEKFAQRIIEAVGTDVRYQGQVLKVGASVGVTPLGKERDSYDAAVKRADSAMYQVKNAGRNGYRVAHQ
jgi:diguanylate cyclase (GGDEF)-like protein